jgi:1-acyl-sn-glycerol-3-phosphate acyltransferase
VHWMVAKEFCQNAVLGVFLRALEVIPTNRTGTDINSTKIAMKYAAQGRLVGMFPEGKINLGSELLLPVRAGAAMVAVKTGVPIIPLYIKGSPYRGTALSPLLMPARVQIVFGKPIYAETRSQTSESNSSDSPQDRRQSSSPNPRTNGNQQAAELIAGWGQEIANLAGQPGFQVQVGSSTRHRNTARASVNSPTNSSDQ